MVKRRSIRRRRGGRTGVMSGGVAGSGALLPGSGLPVRRGYEAYRGYSNEIVLHNTSSLQYQISTPAGTGQAALSNLSRPIAWEASLLNCFAPIFTGGANPNLLNYKFCRIMGLNFRMELYHVSTTGQTTPVRATYLVDTWNYTGIQTLGTTYGNLNQSIVNQITLNQVRDQPVNARNTLVFNYNYRPKFQERRWLNTSAIVTEFAARPGTAVANWLNYQETGLVYNPTTSANFAMSDSLYKNFHVLIAPEVVPASVDAQGNVQNIGIFNLVVKVESRWSFCANANLGGLVNPATTVEAAATTEGEFEVL